MCAIYGVHLYTLVYIYVYHIYGYRYRYAYIVIKWTCHVVLGRLQSLLSRDKNTADNNLECWVNVYSLELISPTPPLIDAGRRDRISATKIYTKKSAAFNCYQQQEACWLASSSQKVLRVHPEWPSENLQCLIPPLREWIYPFYTAGARGGIIVKGLGEAAWQNNYEAWSIIICYPSLDHGCPKFWGGKEPYLSQWTLHLKCLIKSAWHK